MSLLLDALKKAAQDKQKSADKAAGIAPPAPPKKPENTADELELTLDLEALPAATEQREAVQDTPMPAEESALHIEDEPVQGSMADELPTLAEDITPPPAEIRHEAAVVPKPRPIMLTPPAKPMPPPVKLEASSPPPEQSASSSAATATLAAQQAAAKQRDALDMMINKSRQSNEQKTNIQRYGLIALCLLLLIAGGYYFYTSSEPATPVVESPPPESVEIAGTEDPVAAAVQQAAIPVARPAPVKQAASNIPPPRRAAAATKPVAATPVSEPLQFTRTTRPDPIESLLSQAYEKFQAGDYVGANELYTQVLHREVDNRDGLLGAAAVAMKQQRLEHARLQYQKLLYLDPKDTLARAGVSFIDMNVRDESQLKFILREQPDAAHLHFALGALYASQTRWAEAQLAYFNAVTHDSQNADYAYNLAVSLDQLGQYKAARGYYQKALQLAPGQRASFVVVETQTRIDQLSNLPDNSK